STQASVGEHSEQGNSPRILCVRFASPKVSSHQPRWFTTLWSDWKHRNSPTSSTIFKAFVQVATARNTKGEEATNLERQYRQTRKPRKPRGARQGRPGKVL